MGRQLQLATTRADEAELLRFVASLAPIRVFQSFAATPDDLWFADHSSIAVPPRILYIWLQTFPWVPVYKQTGGPGCLPEMAGRFYVANAHTAPILELSRFDLPQGRYGRIYWGHNFSAPRGLDYDEVAFSRLVDTVWRWVRKVSRSVPSGSGTPSLHYLPDAYKSHPPGST